MPEISVDLGPVLRSIHSLEQTVNHNLSVVDQKVGVVYQTAEQTKDRLEELYSEFSAFVDSDRKAKEVQKAITEIVRVRQEIEKTFGHYDEVRRATIGILQATDAGVVRQDTIQTATEQLMVAAGGGYWLAPALVALSSWIGDNQTLAEKALRSAMGRDDYKTSLFFALVCRRAARLDATSRWLTRYFQMQTPISMDREVVVILDAVANGVFGGGALVSCTGVVEQWLAELAQQPGFLAEQTKRWAATLDAMAEPVDLRLEYRSLAACSSTALPLAAALASARRNQVVLAFFSNLFAGEIIVPPSIEQAVDDLLISLVKNFDDAELPLRKEERLYQLIKEEDGETDRAKSRLAAEREVFEEKTSFAALLTNSAVSPQQYGATRATQRYAVSRSRQWILAAQNDLVARDRAQVPVDVQLKCGSWEGASRNGSDETQLTAELVRHYDEKIQVAVDAVKITGAAWAALGGGLFFGLAFLTGGAVPVGLIALVAGVGFFGWTYMNLDKVRQQTKAQMQDEKTKARALLKACLAELADYRRQLASEDAKATKVTEFLESLGETQFLLRGPGQARTSLVS